MSDLLTGAGYKPRVQVLYDEFLVELTAEDGSAARLAQLFRDLMERVSRLLVDAAAARSGDVERPMKNVLNTWVVEDVAAKRRLLDLHRPVSGYCGTCLASDDEGRRFPGPARWPCQTVELLLDPLRRLVEA